MKKWLIRILLILLGLLLVAVASSYFYLKSYGIIGKPVFDSVAPEVPELPHPAILVFSKTNSFRHKQAIPAAEKMFEALSRQNGWSVFVTENGAIHNPEDLARFDALVWNNVTGSVLTEPQQQAFVDYIENGGGWVGIHGAGDSSSDWEWFIETLVGARFKAHIMFPQFQEARLVIETPGDPIVSHLGTAWHRTDEWYSFEESARKAGKDVLATLDETSYTPKGLGDMDLRMGDHPIIWKGCVGNGRSLYSALGHSASSFSEPQYKKLLERAVAWTAGLEGAGCRSKQEIILE